MRFSLKQKICAALMCFCTLFLSGCSFTSILDPDDVYNMDHNDGESNSTNINNNLVFHDTYAVGDRAFRFIDCNEYTDIVDFQYIGLLGETFVYYYCVQSEQKSFYAVAAYNYKSGSYHTIIHESYEEDNKRLINCNHFVLSKDIHTDGTESTASYFINIGYYFYKIKLTSSDNINYSPVSVEGWSIGEDMLLYIRSQFTMQPFEIDVIISDVAPWSKTGDYYTAAIVAIPSDTENITQSYQEQAILFKIQIATTVQVAVQDPHIFSTSAGSYLSTDVDSRACIFIDDITNGKIKFGKCVSSGDTPVNEYFEVKKKSTDKLITFSVINDGNASNSTLLQLVFKNRLEYWKLGIDFTNTQSLNYGATFITSFPLKDAGSYWVSDSSPSITYNGAENSVILASNKHGVKKLKNTPVYDTDGVTVLRTETTEEKIDEEFSAYLTEQYGDDLLLVGFNELKFDRVTDYLDSEGNLIKSKASKEYYSLAQHHLATVRIKARFPDGSYVIPEENYANKDTYADGERAFVFPIIDESAQSTDSQSGFIKISDIQNEYTKISDFRYIGLLGNTFIYCYSVVDENDENKEKHCSIAAYNFKTKTYTEIFRKKIDEGVDAKCNPMLISKDTSKDGTITATYMVNVGYSFIKISLSSTDALDFSPIEVDEWEIDSKMLETIKGFFVDNLESTVSFDVKVSGIGPWAMYADMYSVAFTNINTGGSSDFVEKTVIVKLTLTKTVLQDGTNTVYHTMQAKVQEGDIKSTSSGFVLSADIDLDNSIFIKDIAADKITFGKCDQRGVVYFDVEKKSSDELLSFSVVTDGNFKNNSLLQLVYSNRAEYWSLGKNSSSSSSFRATLVAEFPLDKNMSSSISDSIPSISYDSKTDAVTLSSNKQGVKKLINTPVYAEDGVTVISKKITEEKLDTDFSAYMTLPYGSSMLVLGFEGFQFDRINGYYDPKGNYIKIKDTKEYYTSEQLPFATVKILG